MRQRNIIDIWDPRTFDAELSRELEANAAVLRAYSATQRRIDEEYEHADYRTLRETNPYGDDYNEISERICRLLKTRTIRVFHYTRLTADEVETLRREGIRLPSLADLKRRLADRVRAGDLTDKARKQLLEKNSHSECAPLPERNSSRLAGKITRAGTFSVVTPPLQRREGGIENFLGKWGGEALYRAQPPALITLLETIGIPRILEIALPLREEGQAFKVARTLIALVLDPHDAEVGCPLVARQGLGPECILAVHTEGEDAFAAMGDHYPTNLLSAQTADVR